MDVEDLFVIATDLVNLRVVVDAPPPELAKIRPGQEAVIQIAELPDGVLGKVSEVQEGRAVIEFTNPNPAVVKPGMTVHVLIKVEEKL
jgi:multidrug efflux pump subunit AcrA (membrane-fusion protein)